MGATQASGGAVTDRVNVREKVGADASGTADLTFSAVEMGGGERLADDDHGEVLKGGAASGSVGGRSPRRDPRSRPERSGGVRPPGPTKAEWRGSLPTG